MKTPLTTTVVTVATIMDETLPKSCGSKDDGICRLNIGACQQCYPKEVQLTGYFFTKEQLEELIIDAYDEGRGAEYEKDRMPQIDWEYMDQPAYIKSLLP